MASLLALFEVDGVWQLLLNSRAGPDLISPLGVLAFQGGPNFILAMQSMVACFGVTAATVHWAW